jgi:DNA-binding NtrC family response regulator
VRSKPGKFEMANKGTIFLDEIAEMSPHLQAKLLHVLQDHQYSRLGARHMVEVDVRILAATNVEVQEAMKSGHLREDLYYRLNVLSIQRAAFAGTHHGNPAALPAFLEQVCGEIQERIAHSFRTFDGSGHPLSVAGEFAGAGKFRQALRDS